MGDTKQILESCRLFLTPYLPPPVIELMHSIDTFFLTHNIPEASMSIVSSLLIAFLFLKIIGIVTNSGSSNNPIHDDDDVIAGGGTTTASSKGGNTSLVVICGAPHAGKTVLFHALCRTNHTNEGSIMTPTVTSMKALEGTVTHHPTTSEEEEEEDGKEVRIMDYPGHVRLRDNLPRIASNADRVVLVADSTKSVKESADVLYLLLTNPIVQESWKSNSGKHKHKMQILVVCSKSDLPNAKNCQRMKLSLRTELDRMRKANLAWKKSRGTGGGTANTGLHGVEGDHDESSANQKGNEIPLGVTGKNLDLDTCEDLPCQLTFVSASCNDVASTAGFISTREFVLGGRREVL